MPPRTIKKENCDRSPTLSPTPKQSCPAPISDEMKCLSGSRSASSSPSKRSFAEYEAGASSKAGCYTPSISPEPKLKLKAEATPVDDSVHTRNPMPSPTKSSISHLSIKENETAPMHCDVACERKITRPENKNGNADRPYYLCTTCSSFITWADDVGIRGTNPICDCGRHSREDVTNKGHKYFYTCSRRQCGYFEWLFDKDGAHVCATAELASSLKRQRIL